MRPAPSEIEREPTSTVLDRLLTGAPDAEVSLGWLIDGLRERSFGIVMLILGLIALVPGASGIVGVLLMTPAAQMILTRKARCFRVLSRAAAFPSESSRGSSPA